MRRVVLALALAACHGKDAPAPPRPDVGPAQETIPPGEDVAIAEITKMLVDFVQHRDHDRFARRDAHVKAHGCVRAEFRVLPNLPEALARGVFAAPRTYPAWIRFSNSADRIRNDHRADGRGMAVKLMGVSDEQPTQDFVLINYPVFVVRDATDYVEFTRDSDAGHPLRFFLHGGRGRLPELKSAEHMALQRPRTPLVPTYYSMTPYLLGEGQAVKYGARPCAEQPKKGRRCGPDFLRHNLVDALVDTPACFQFMVQLQADPRTMPIEDPTVEWNPEVSPYVAVAEITIPEQRFDSVATDRMCEFMSFSPWHALPEHRPLGGINRVRKAVYPTISALRHRLDGVKELEPTSWDVRHYLQAIGADPGPGEPQRATTSCAAH